MKKIFVSILAVLLISSCGSKYTPSTDMLKGQVYHLAYLGYECDYEISIPTTWKIEIDKSDRDFNWIIISGLTTYQTVEGKVIKTPVRMSIAGIDNCDEYTKSGHYKFSTRKGDNDIRWIFNNTNIANINIIFSNFDDVWLPNILVTFSENVSANVTSEIEDILATIKLLDYKKIK